MPRLAMILSLAAFAAFNYVQYQGWSLFADNADPVALRPGQAARVFHK